MEIQSHFPSNHLEDIIEYWQHLNTDHKGAFSRNRNLIVEKKIAIFQTFFSSAWIENFPFLMKATQF